MKQTVSKFWLYASIILALVIALLMWEQHKIHNALENVFVYSYHVTVVDKDTGEILNPSVRYPAMPSEDLFHQGTVMRASIDGSVTISGVGYMLRTYTFGLDGYRAKELTIGHNSGFADVEVRLKRIASQNGTKSGQSGPLD